ncbi:MAG: Hsp33 family molecular chaperone HslO [Methylophilaceae bacterium]|nr:Hsp33 family molecular chaperone HslO [Methylophilaceae bacterium]
MSPDSSHSDSLQRFIFENSPVRGNIVRLNQTFNTALQHQNCPPALRKALGELMAAAALLAATLKMQGALVLQIQGNGALKLLVVECTAELTLRATAKWTENLIKDDLADTDFADSNFAELVGDGQFVITLDPKDGGQGYQGIVQLEGNSIAEVLQNYMQRSEQIETRIWLACDNQTAAGMLLQKLPDFQSTDLPEQDADLWERTGYLANTMRQDELLHVPAEDLLLRLFHEETVRLFDAQPVKFHCTCSRTSVGSMLRLLGAPEVTDILEDNGDVEVHCDFCNAAYVFDKVDVEQLFSADIMMPSTNSKH